VNPLEDLPFWEVIIVRMAAKEQEEGVWGSQKSRQAISTKISAGKRPELQIITSRAILPQIPRG